MKIKLLKKVRKRFEIIHMPNGYVNYEGHHYNYNLFKLIDHKESHWYDRYVQLGRKESKKQYTNDIFDTEQECINHLKSKIINRLRGEGYRQRKDITITNSQKKVWHI